MSNLKTSGQADQFNSTVPEAKKRLADLTREIKQAEENLSQAASEAVVLEKFLKNIQKVIESLKNLSKLNTPLACRLASLAESELNAIVQQVCATAHTNIAPGPKATHSNRQTAQQLE